MPLIKRPAEPEFTAVMDNPDAHSDFRIWRETPKCVRS